MVVVDPDDIVGPQHGSQRHGQAPVYAGILLEISRFKLCQIEPVVKYWPEYGIGIAKIIPVVLGLRQWNGDNLAPHLRRSIRIARNFSTPAEPKCRPSLEDFGQCNSNAASLGCFPQIQDPI